MDCVLTILRRVVQYADTMLNALESPNKKRRGSPVPVQTHEQPHLKSAFLTDCDCLL